MIYTQGFLTLRVGMTTNEVLRLFSQKKHSCYGFAVVLDEDDHFFGILSVSDFLAFATNIEGNKPGFAPYVNQAPYTIAVQSNLSKITTDAINQLVPDPHCLPHQYTPIISGDNKVYGIYDRAQALLHINSNRSAVCLIGMGFVGLTLAIGLASKGLTVYGHDKNTELLDSIRNGETTVKEPDIENKTKDVIDSKRLTLIYDLAQLPSSVNTFIICVGTPIDNKGNADLTAIYQSIESVSTLAKSGDLIVLRSTVPVGTSRALSSTIQSFNPKLVPGENLFLSFSPERTVEGNAIQETFSIPQIIGGLTRVCTLVSSTFWKQVNTNIVSTQSLEEAELVKLVNNSFRDLSFAFANSLIDLCEPLNISVSSLIKSANLGYPRNRISLPSPGVGGYCLTKDPLLLANSWKSDITLSDHPGKALPLVSRDVNKLAATYPLRQFRKFLETSQSDPNDLKILICGLAFKGLPETNDLRGSCGVELFHDLSLLCRHIYLYDAVADLSTLNCNLHISHTSDYNAIFIMNNHPSNYSVLQSILSSNIRLQFVFDGWESNKLTSSQLQSIDYFSIIGQTFVHSSI